MFILPIVSRELRVAARRRSLYRQRVVLGILTVGLGAFFLLVGENLTAVRSGASGRTLFVIISVLLFAGAVAAAHPTHDCISEEKREGTLGLLFLTDLSGLDVILGKLFAAALPSFYGLMATLPALMAAVLMGGVTGQEVWETSLALLNLFFFGQCAAILASTLSRRRAVAAKWTVAILGFFVVGLVMVGACARHEIWLAESFNPAFTFAMASRIGSSSGSEGEFWLSLATVTGTGCVFLAAACLVVPRSWQERPAEKGHARIRNIGPVLKDKNPFAWLVSRRLERPRWIWISLVALISVEVTTLILTKARSTWWIMAALGISHVLLKLWVAALTGRAMEESRRDGSLEILLACTALKEKEIFQGLSIALRRLFIGPMFGLLALDVIALCIVPGATYKLMIAGLLVALPVDLVTLPWLATWFAMRLKKPGRAGFIAFFWVCVFPGFFFAAPILIAGSAADFSEGFYCLMLVGFFVDGILISITREKLLIHLRALSRAVNANARPAGLFEELTAQERLIVLRS